MILYLRIGFSRTGVGKAKSSNLVHGYINLGMGKRVQMGVFRIM